MRKPAPMALSVLLATLLAALLLPASAFADDNEDDSPSSSSSKSQAEKQETENKHKEIEGIYKNPGRISLPPIVIHPKVTKQSVTPPSGAEIGSNPIGSPKLEIANNENTIGSEVVPDKGISGMNPESKSDAQRFIEAAYVGLGAMAIGALALGITAGTRSIRRK